MFRRTIISMLAVVAVTATSITSIPAAAAPVPAAGVAPARVAAADPQTVVTLAVPSGVKVGQPANVTVTVTGVDQTGTVTVTGGPEPVTQALIDGTATVELTGLSAGTHTLVASYSGDGTSSQAAQLVIEKWSTAVQVGSLEPAVVLGTATAEVTVETTDGPMPTGQVEVVRGGQQVAVADLSPSGTAQLSFPAGSPGTVDLTINYLGDASTAASTAQAPLTVVKRTAGAILELSPDIAASGTALTATVRVEVDDPQATGTVTVTGPGIAATGSLNAGTAVIQLPKTLAAGSYQLTAEYSGDVNTAEASSPPTTLTVTKAGATLGLSPTKPAFGTSARIGVLVTGPSAVPTGEISAWYNGSRYAVGSLTDGRTTLVLPANVAPGTRTYALRYHGDSRYETIVGTTTVTVLPATPRLSFTATTPAYGTSAKIGVTATGTGAVPTGKVSAWYAGYWYASAYLSGGKATLTLPSGLATGTRTFTIQYAGDSRFAPVAGSKAVTVTRSAVRLYAVTAYPHNTTPYGSTPMLRVAGATAGPKPTGTIRVYHGSKQLATGKMVAGAVTVPLPRMQPGRYPLTVRFDPTTLHYASSYAMVLTVGRAASTVTVSSPGAVAGRPVTVTVAVRNLAMAPTGTVTLTEGTITHGTTRLSSSGTATFTLRPLTAGTHTLSVRYSGDVRYGPAGTGTLVQVTKARSFGDGTFRVGLDIPAGLYRVKLPAGNLCYWARLNNASGSLASINANQLETGYGLIRVLPTDAYVQSARCGTWRLVSETARWPFAGGNIPGDGAFLVGVDISPGTYLQSSPGCYIELLSDVTGDFSEIIENDYSEGPTELWLGTGVYAIRVHDCSTWVRR